MVVGSGGAGKSTFADALGAHTGLPVTHLDELFWHPGWVETPRDEWAARQAEMVAAPAWILDGNYSATIDVRFARADTVILVDTPRTRCLWRVLKRTIRSHAKERTAVGCPDHFDVPFLRWIWTYPTRSRPKVLAAVREHGDHVNFVRLRTPAAARAYLRDLGHTGPGDGDR
jgi:adenylate kinase family enzyme